MKPKHRHTTLASVLVILVVLSLLASCGQPQGPTGPTPTPTTSAADKPVDSYLALAPRVLRAGQSEAVSVLLFDGDNPSAANVQLTLLSKDQAQVAQTAGYIDGRGTLNLTIPAVPEGDYELKLQGASFQGKTALRVEEGTLVFMETDKPIYKPGQTLHARILTLDAQLKPVTGMVTMEAQDAKGIKVYKKELTTDDFGMASLDLPLSTEPNLGTWKLIAKAGKQETQVDVQVERYVLPKYEVKASTSKDWALANEPIKGTVAAEYTFGKPVRGEVEIRASKYVGKWQEFATITKEIDGKLDFEIPAVGYVSGTPANQGQGNVTLDVTVREKSTGYEEKTTKLLTVAQSNTVIAAIPDSGAFKPGLPLNILFTAETPDKKGTDADVTVTLSYVKSNFQQTTETRQVQVRGGRGILKVTPPADSIALSLNASAKNAYVNLTLKSGYSPSGSFIHLEQVGSTALKIGDSASFKVYTTKEARNFYYEIVARGKVVFSSVSTSPDIRFTVTPAMAPGAKLLVYQILPNSEVAADYLPFSVEGQYPQKLTASFSSNEVKPGDDVTVTVQSEGTAKVGLAIVDRSVFILAENRLNLQQVFAELERVYMSPQAELHEAILADKIVTNGAQETLRDAGVAVISNKQVPTGKEYIPRADQTNALLRLFGAKGARDGVLKADVMELGAVPAASATQAPQAAQSTGLAEVQRVRQFFPETWLWSILSTDASGKAAQKLTAPDSITTWMLRAVALSKEKGLGVAEAQLKVMQPFFVTADLPYAAIRGEQFPIRIALYNYLSTPQDFTVEIEKSDWFDLVGTETSKTVQVAANGLGGVEFPIRAQKLGTQKVKVTARSRDAADALVKEIIIEPEGVAREDVQNLVLAAGQIKQLASAVPMLVIEGSTRSYVGITGNYLTQSIQGLESLIKMPFGCGEQNMILFAPNVFVTKYLKETGQMKPEIMAKAESMMLTGYQRELIYRHKDGSFSAFGESDKSGSLWLTAFVLKTFAQGKDLIYVDDSVLTSAKAWIAKQQKADGSFDQVGFVAHQDMMGGVQGKIGLTAYVAIALLEAGDTDLSGKAIAYLEKSLTEINDSYGTALVTYALAKAKSAKTDEAIGKLLKLAKESDEGLYWGGDAPQPLQSSEQDRMVQPVAKSSSTAVKTTSVESTAYALLALLEKGDKANAARAARWLVSQRNAYGGYGSTQDTVIGLQALSSFAANSRTDVNGTVTLKAGEWQKEITIDAANSDVLQVVDAPAGSALTAEFKGSGQALLQFVQRYNISAAEPKNTSAFQIDVKYSADKIEVDDLLKIDASILFTPPENVQAGMVVVDIAVPTGFEPVSATIDAAAKMQPKVKRFDVAGRKVVFYIEDMAPQETISLSFQAKALYPIRAQAVTSQVYSYYKPELRGESLGGAITVGQ